MNLLLLCGLDGTGLLFEPFLQVMPSEIRSNIELLIYDLNGHTDTNNDNVNNSNNQDLTYQAKRIEGQVTDRFADESIVIISESYSGLLVYQLLRREIANIEQVFFIACFLQKPSQIARLAKHAYFIKPSWTTIIPDKALSYLLFNRFGSAELLALFRQAMTELEEPDKRARFYQRCENIANLPKKLSNEQPNKPSDKFDYKSEDEIIIPCVYLQANQDNLVSSDNLPVFKERFKNLSVVPLDGSHFLLQTNAIGVWDVIIAHTTIGNY